MGVFMPEYSPSAGWLIKYSKACCVSHIGTRNPRRGCSDAAQEKFSSALPLQEWYRLLRTAARSPGPKPLCVDSWLTHTGCLRPQTHYGLTGDWWSRVSFWLRLMALLRSLDSRVSPRRPVEAVIWIRDNELVWEQCWRKRPWQPFVRCKCLWARPCM